VAPPRRSSAILSRYDAFLTLERGLNSEAAVIEVENRTIITASPLRVWTALASLAEYGRWHPFIRLSGAPAVGAKVGYTFTPVAMKRMLTTSATITAFEKPARIGWRAGLPGIMTTEELFELSAASEGTEVRHRSAYRGFLAPWRSESRRQRLLDAVVETDAALERFLRQPTKATPSARRGRGSARGNPHPFRKRPK
jgi:hypothetical protein